MKLTKTQRILIDTAEKQNGRVGIVYGVERHKNFGERQRNAANTLVRLGVFELVWRDSESLGYGPNGGNLGFAVNISYKLV